MRTFEDTFSGEKIYPGKVSPAEFLISHPCLPVIAAGATNHPLLTLQGFINPKILTMSFR